MYAANDAVVILNIIGCYGSFLIGLIDAGAIFHIISKLCKS